MPDFVVVVSVPSRTKAKNVLVLDADNGFHARIAAYMFVVQPLHPPADAQDVMRATDGPNPQGPLKIDERVSARIYNPDPYRDFPGQRNKPGKSDAYVSHRKYAYTEHGAAILTLAEKIVGLYHCIKKGHNEDALGHLFDLLHHVAPDLTVRDVGGEPVVVGLEALAEAYGANPAPIKEGPCQSARGCSSAGVARSGAAMGHFVAPGGPDVIPGDSA